jgi:hypothetical protein
MASRRTVELPPPPEGPDRPVVLVRVYPGFHEEALELFQVDAEILAPDGYVPVAQSYAEGRYAGWYVTVATILVIFAIGILLLIYMAAVRPPGNLAVTYVLRTTA